MSVRYCNLDFSLQSYNRNNAAYEQIIKQKQLRLVKYKQSQEQKETNGPQQEGSIQAPEDLQQKVQKLKHLQISDINNELQPGRVKINGIEKSIKINGINLVAKHYKKFDDILKENPNVLSGFIVNNNVKWPLNEVFKRDPDILKFVKTELKKGGGLRSFEKCLNDSNTIISMNCISAMNHIPLVLQRLMKMMSDEEFKLVYISVAFGLAESVYDMVMNLLNKLIKTFKMSINKPRKIVLCCNQVNLKQTMKALSDQQDQLFKEKQILLE